MNASAPPTGEAPGLVFRAIVRGFIDRCPKCGRGRLLAGYTTPIPECGNCGENLAPYQTADFASYFVMFAVGLLATPLVLVLSMRSADNIWPAIVVAVLAVASILLLLPRVKGAGIALLWALDVKANQ